MVKVQTVGIIRERGQITIPDTIRKVAKWANPSSVVTISLEKPDEIRIQPHQTKEAIDWNKVWDAITLARSFKGKRSNISSLIAKDRESGHD